MTLNRRIIEHFIVAAALAAPLTLPVALLWEDPIIDSFDNWTWDFRARLESAHLPSEHPKITLVMLDEYLMRDQPVRLPISRKLLKDIFDAVATLRPKAIGLDIVLGIKADGDAELAQAIRKAKNDGIVTVLATARDSRPNDLARERELNQDNFVRAAGGPSTGYANLRTERDGVIRSRAAPVDGQSDLNSFAAVLSAAGGASEASLARLASADTSRRIAWLGQPLDGGPPFARIPAAALIGPSHVTPDSRMRDLIRDRIVIIGGDFIGIDRTRTPLTAANSDVTGAEVHAQLVAEILDDRYFNRLPFAFAIPLTFCIALVGVLVGWHWSQADLLLGTVVLLLYSAFDHFILVSTLHVLVPFLVPAFAWGGGIMLGEALRSASAAATRLSKWMSRRAKWPVQP